MRIAHNGHTLRVAREEDWGDPRRYQAFCSCGWRGTVTDPRAGLPAALDPVLRVLARRYSLPVVIALLRELPAVDDSVALAEGLAHLSYPAEEKLQEAREELFALRDLISTQGLRSPEEVEEALGRLARLEAGQRQAEKLLRAQATVKLPSPVEVPPEAASLYSAWVAAPVEERPLILPEAEAWVTHHLQLLGGSHDHHS